MLYCLSECYIFSKNYEKLLNDSRRSNSPCCQRMRARYSLHGQSRIEGEFDRSLVLHDRTVPDEIFDPVRQFPDASPDVIDIDRITRSVEIRHARHPNCPYFSGKRESVLFSNVVQPADATKEITVGSSSFPVHCFFALI